MFEQRLIYYCAPTLAGLKTAGLFNTHGIPDAIVKQEANRLTGLLATCGLALRLFAKKDRATLVYLYRESDLARDLANPDVRAFLLTYGYQLETIDTALDSLEKRIQTCPAFPHEVGVFLSYPLEDVKSFIALGGAQCLLCGHWCAYSETENAQLCFNRYDRCSHCYRNLYRRGRRLPELAVAR